MGVVARVRLQNGFFMGDSQMRMFVCAMAACWMLGAAIAQPAQGDVSQIDELIEQFENIKRNGKSNEDGEKLLSRLKQLRKAINGDPVLVQKGMQTAKADIRTYLGSPAACMSSTDDKVQLLSYEQQVERILSGKASVESLRKYFGEENKVGSCGYVDTTKLLRGDLVFVRNKSVWAKNLIEASTREKRFSHIGIITDSKKSVRLITVAANEVTGRGCVSERSFVALHGIALDLAVYRYSGSDAEKVRERIARAAEKRIGTPFDPAFDLKTKDRLYCTEMVRDCVNEAAGREVIGTSCKDDFEYVAVDDCYRNEMTKVWDCRDQKPKEKQPIQKLQSRPTVTESSSTTNAPVRRTIRFIPQNR